MAERDVRERDILIAPNEYTYVQDLTKGDIVLYVGPTKISLSNTERIVEFRDGRFVPVRAEDGAWGVHANVMATSSQYILLSNPPKDGAARPVKGNNSAIELLIGRRVVIPGPASFPLWPGQQAEVIDAHKLREDQYLLVRVYDKVEGDPRPIGTETIAKGSEVSFYIPRTGEEVVPGKDGYVRTAVTLLDGQYCILLKPDGRRKYARGPAIVFPEPTEEFVEREGNDVFQAYPLRPNTGLHVRVVRDFAADEGDQIPPGAYQAGQELFIRGREGPFFTSRWLEVIGAVEAIPISDKEGIYVRDIASGKIGTEVGPQNYLADPTRVEIVARALDPELAKLYGVAPGVQPRALSIYIPPSYAVLVTAKDRREVVRGPQTRILSFDEELEVLTLSTGKPKNDEVLLRTCFLQTDGNKVSDIIRVRTRDHVELDLLLSYRVSFQVRKEHGAERWFNVKNYVALMCDHLGSIVRGAARGVSIEDFQSNSAEVVRNAILGEKPGDGKRQGRFFEENGMWVYDVEILDVKILDAEVKGLLDEAQRAAIVADLHARQEGFRLSAEQLKERVNQDISLARTTTLVKERDRESAASALAEAKARAAVELERIERVGKGQAEAEALEVLTEARVAAARRHNEVEQAAQAARVEAFAREMASIQPELLAVLKTLSARQFTAEVSRNLSPLAILGGESVSEVLERLLKSLPIGFGPTPLPAPHGASASPKK